MNSKNRNFCLQIEKNYIVGLKIDETFEETDKDSLFDYYRIIKEQLINSIKTHPGEGKQVYEQFFRK